MGKIYIGSTKSRIWLLGKLILVAVSIVIIFALSNLLAQVILRTPQIGFRNEIHVVYIDWLNQFFPDVPHWFPRAGGGVSLLYGQPLLGHFVTIVAHRVSDLSLIQAYRLINFLVFPLTALGIYFLGWSASRRQSVGLLSAFFYLLAPASWVDLSEGGLLPSSVAMIFLPLTLICLNGFLAHHLARSDQGRRRVWLIGLILSLAGAILTDSLVSAAAVLLALLYTFLTSLLQRPDRRGAYLIRATWGVLVAGLILLFVLSFNLIPRFRYNGLVGIVDFDSSTPNTLALPSIPQLFGFASLETKDGMVDFQFPLTITVPFLIGALLSFLNTREARVLYIAAILAFIWVFIPQLQMIVPTSSLGLQTLLSPQAWCLILMVLVPVGGAWGVHSLARTIINPKSILNRGGVINDESAESALKLRRLVSSALTIGLAGGIIAFTPINLGNGPLSGSEGRGSVLRELASMEWSNYEINDKPPTNSRAEGLVTYLPEKDILQIDVSPHLEGLGDELLAISDASQIHIAPRELSLIQPGWEYQRNVFYSRDLGVDEFGNVESLNNVAQYFGTEYVFLDTQQDLIELYKAAGWELVHGQGGVQLWYYPDSTELVSFSSKPAILVTEKLGREIYMSVFRLANDGFLPYQEALLIEGKERIDSYTIDNLKPFDAIFLVGYDYRNQSKAWGTLAAYVEQGGSLFVDTGWQFAVAEWEFESAPDVLPIDQLTWMDYGMNEEYELGQVDITEGVDISQFKPLVWEGQPWALSGAEPSNVREWGMTVLSAAGKPLIVAGEYGEGRVVWSGMNLINHALYMGESEAELHLFHNLLNWLLDGKEGEDLQRPVVERDTPDQIMISLEAIPSDDTWLYWREAIYPNWHAYLIDDNGQREIPIYGGGPGFMIMPIETSSDNASVILTWETSVHEKMAIIPSILGVFILGALAVDGLILGGNGFTWIRIAFAMRLPKPFLDEETHKEAGEQKTIKSVDYGEISMAGENKMESDQSIVNGDHLETQINDEQKKLLESWLNDKNHDDDPWIRRILDPDRGE